MCSMVSDELLKELGFRALKGVVDKEEASHLYAIVRASLDSMGGQQEEVWDLMSNQDSREACLADPTLPRCWQTRPGKLPNVLCRDPLKRANEPFAARWHPAKDLHPTQCSSLATGDDGGQQDWQFDVDQLPATLPTRGALPTHLSMMLVLCDKYHLELHVGSHLGDHDALRVQTVVCERGDVVVFASTLRHRCLCALPGVGKQIVLVRFLTVDLRHQLVGRGPVHH